MKKIIFFLITLLFMTQVHSQEQARLVRIIDGDTFVAEWKHKQYTCRLKNVDAPEASQKYGSESTNYLYQLLKGRKFSLEAHRTDLYRRMIVSVTIDGKRLDSLLIRNGAAWLYSTYSSDPILINCMKYAIQDKRGLWKCGKETVCPPWLYRQYSYRNKVRYCKGCNS